MSSEVTNDFENSTGSTATGNGSDSTGTSSSLTDTVSNVVGQIHDQVAPAVSQTKEKAGEIAGQVTQQATSRLDEHKSQAAGSLGSVAEALRQSSQQLRDQDQGVVGQYAGQYGETIANQVERISTFLQEKDTKEIVQEVESFARREPALFIGGAFLLGLLGARLLKSAPSASASTSSFSSSRASSSASSSYSPSSTSTSEAIVPLSVPIPEAPTIAGASSFYDNTSSGESATSDDDTLEMVATDPFYDVDDAVILPIVDEPSEGKASSD